MLSQSLVLSITEKVISHSLVFGQQPFKYKIFIKVFQWILKSLEASLIRNYFLVMPKNASKTHTPKKEKVREILI